MCEGHVFTYNTADGDTLTPDVRSVISAVAESIASLRQFKYCGNGPLSFVRDVPDTRYYVPDDTLTETEFCALGIDGPDNFFGGLVPRPFIKTKAVTHGLVGSRSERPDGWSTTFSERVREVVPLGFSAFAPVDARAAAERLLRLGPVRLKPTRAASGQGQVVINNLAGVDAFLENYAEDELQKWGLVLETDLSDVTTLNIGRVNVGDLALSYHGIQLVTIGPSGKPEYGGSSLTCVRGDWSALYSLPLTPNVDVAIGQAIAFDQATNEYPGFAASRRNYDVGCGRDSSGRLGSGVFEASWRVGAASTAELAALTIFSRDPEIRVVEVSAVRSYTTEPIAPESAIVHYVGEDKCGTRLIRYTVVTRMISDISNTRL